MRHRGPEQRCRVLPKVSERNLTPRSPAALPARYTCDTASRANRCSTQPTRWSVVNTLALDAAIGALIGFLIMLAVTVRDFVADARIAAHHIAAD
jgi:hypothetical protein